MSVASIVMCGYNSEKYLSRSIGSILNQSYPEIELIFVDDGSQDHTFETAKTYIEAFQQKGYSLKVFRQANQGPGYAAIHGLKEATGTYLSFLDSDDALLPTSIEKRVKALEDHSSINIVRTNGYRVFEGTNKPKELIVKDAQEKEESGLFDKIVIGTANNFAGTFMIRAEALHSFYKSGQVPCSDYGQNLQLILPGAYQSNQVFIDEPLMEYYIYPNTHSHKKTTEEKIRMYEGWFNLRKKILEENTAQSDSVLIKSRILCIKNILDCILEEKDQEKKQLLFDKYYKELGELNGRNAEYKMYNALIHKSRRLLFYKLLFFIERKIQ